MLYIGAIALIAKSKASFVCSPNSPNDFSNPYLASDLAFLFITKDVPNDLGTKENPATYEQLLNLFDGKSLVCQSGVVGDDFIDTYFVNNKANKEIK